jgi:hypothetical protein
MANSSWINTLEAIMFLNTFCFSVFLHSFVVNVLNKEKKERKRQGEWKGRGKRSKKYLGS